MKAYWYDNLDVSLEEQPTNRPVEWLATISMARFLLTICNTTG